MDFESAVTLSREVEQAFPAIMVGGLRRLSRERYDSWGLDVYHRDSGRMVTLDEKDDWERILQVNFGELSRTG